MDASTILSPAVSSPSCHGSPYFLMKDKFKHGLYLTKLHFRQCKCQVIICRYMIVVTTNIVTQPSLQGLVAGPIAVAEVQTCRGVYMNQWIRLSSAVTRKGATSGGLGRLWEQIV